MLLGLHQEHVLQDLRRVQWEVRARASSPSGPTGARWSSAPACSCPTWATSSVRGTLCALDTSAAALPGLSDPAGRPAFRSLPLCWQPSAAHLSSVPVALLARHGCDITNLRLSPCTGAHSDACRGANSLVSTACTGAGSTDQGLDSLLADASASRTGEHRRAAMHTSWRPWTDDERAEAAREGGPMPCWPTWLAGSSEGAGLGLYGPVAKAAVHTVELGRHH